eukprot:TRINITY_DN8342_c0_g2_i1.p1 TRINITY_DN8342_c0_g2~~TRINITY_DN8342_c0_g2_i1.p1  ORF type:complete len:319 (+),score=70.90 TRINITY_DN8342_c0_g2_i1:44-1000(+)
MAKHALKMLYNDRVPASRCILELGQMIWKADEHVMQVAGKAMREKDVTSAMWLQNNCKGTVGKVATFWYELFITHLEAKQPDGLIELASSAARHVKLDDNMVLLMIDTWLVAGQHGTITDFLEQLPYATDLSLINMYFTRYYRSPHATIEGSLMMLSLQQAEGLVPPDDDVLHILQGMHCVEHIQKVLKFVKKYADAEATYPQSEAFCSETAMPDAPEGCYVEWWALQGLEKTVPQAALQSIALHTKYATAVRTNYEEEDAIDENTAAFVTAVHAAAPKYPLLDIPLDNSEVLTTYLASVSNYILLSIPWDPAAPWAV